MPLIVAYKGCPCCGRVVPDTRTDQLGTCDVCHCKRQLVPKPIGWDAPVLRRHETRDPPRGVYAYTTLWMQAFLSRPPEKLCAHERRAA